MLRMSEDKAFYWCGLSRATPIMKLFAYGDRVEKANDAIVALKFSPVLLPAIPMLSYIERLPVGFLVWKADSAPPSQDRCDWPAEFRSAPH